jgi:hypothetical protein
MLCERQCRPPRCGLSSVAPDSGSDALAGSRRLRVLAAVPFVHETDTFVGMLKVEPAAGSRLQ